MVAMLRGVSAMRVRLARFEGTFEGVSKVSKPHMPPDEKEPRAGGGSGKSSSCRALCRSQ